MASASSSLDLWPWWSIFDLLMELCCEFVLEDRNPVFSHDIQAITIPSLVTKGSAVHKLDNHPLKFLTFGLILILSNPIFYLDTLVYDDIPSI